MVGVDPSFAWIKESMYHAFEKEFHFVMLRERSKSQYPLQQDSATRQCLTIR